MPDTEVCAVAGKMVLGADCANTLSDKKRSMTFEEFVEYLEPSDTHGPALCQKTSDWNKLKTALEQACHKLGSQCTYEIQEAIAKAGERINSLAK